VGSFLNVVIYRLPRGLSIYKPQWSFCPNCKNRLTGLDLVPLLSWLFLRGKCRQCGVKISPRYMFVEIINGALWAAIWYQQLVQGGDPIRAIAYSVFASALVAAIFTDLAHYIIPDQINAFMLVAGLGMNVAMIAAGRTDAFIMGIPVSVAGALVGWGILWGIALLGRLLFGKDAMGHGDIKMARGIGAVVGPAAAVLSFGIAIVLGAVIGILIVLLRRRKAEAEDDTAEDEEPYEPESIGSLFKCGAGYLLCVDVVGLAIPKLYEGWFGEDPYAVEEIEDDPQVELTMIPFGPYLAAGALVAVLYGPQLLAMWDHYWKSATGS
jgi:leader peptidase (prepilin peptidase)/N-methyltransferase